MVGIGQPVNRTNSAFGVAIRTFIAILSLSLCACGGTKILRSPEPLISNQAIASASDQNFTATLDWVIFRDGPGTWARNVDWDEYLIRVQNLGDQAIQLTAVNVVDSLGTRIEPQHSRSALVDGTKQTKRRYKDEGLTVKAGLSGSVLLGAGVVAAAGTSGLGAAAMASGGAAAGAAAVVVLVPALAVSGIVRGVNNSKVNNQIETRQRSLPISLDANETTNFHLFFPLAPSPQQLEFSYNSNQGQQTLILDTGAALRGLHLETVD